MIKIWNTSIQLVMEIYYFVLIDWLHHIFIKYKLFLIYFIVNPLYVTDYLTKTLQ